jgi:hypothetical protein
MIDSARLFMAQMDGFFKMVKVASTHPVDGSAHGAGFAGPQTSDESWLVHGGGLELLADKIAAAIRTWRRLWVSGFGSTCHRHGSRC